MKTLILIDLESCIVKRIQNYKRPALIEGSIELLVKYMKEKKMKVLK